MNHAARPCPPCRPRRTRLVTAFLCAGLVFGGAVATATPTAAAATRVAQANNGVSLEQATQMVRERTGGQVLRAETKRDKGRVVHRIRVLTDDGRVRTWHVDAASGQIY
jgi:hypothetical protein